MAALLVAHLCWPDGALGRTTFLIGTGGAALVAWWAVVRMPRGQRAAAGWLAFGITASAVGDATWDVLAAVRASPPDVSIADIAWFASYVGVALGVMRLGSARGGSRVRRFEDHGLIDMAVAATVSLMVVWHLWVGPTLADTTTPWTTRIVWASYPVLDAALLGLLVRTLVDRRIRGATLWLLAGGVAAWLSGDIAYLAIGEGTPLDRFMNVGWMIGAFCLAAAAARSGATQPDTSTAETSTDPGLGVMRIAAAVLPLMVPGALELFAFGHGEDVNPIPLLVGSGILVVLAFVRMLMLSVRARTEQEHLRRSQKLYERLSENSSDAVVLVGQDGTILNDSARVCDLLGYPIAPTIGIDAVRHVSEVTGDQRARDLLDQCIFAPDKVVHDELLIQRTDGTPIWLAVRAINLLADDAVHAIVVNLHDITQRKHAELELEHQAFHDVLTGLANRALFRDRIQYALERRARTGVDPVVLFVDLDRFKSVNDSLGHEAGDELLRAISGRLSLIVRSGDTVARLGGDEFAVLVEPMADPVLEASALADRVLDAMRHPVRVGDQEIAVSASIGLAIADADSSPSSLLRDADVAMYQAKTSGRAQWVRYDHSMRDAVVASLQITNDLAAGLAERQFRLVYQPVVRLADGEVEGFEALIRWDHPTLGLLAPDAFIPIAEETGQIVPIGRWVLLEACRTAARWRSIPSQAHLSMAINVSGRQLGSATLSDDIRDALTTSGLEPSALVLELTESALIDDPSTAAQRLNELRRLGIRLAVDDFGTGYSSLSYLRQFPFDILKVDRSFVQTITAAGETPAIVRGLVELGHTLQLRIVAEGIESETQLAHLRNEHCEQGQGYLFSRPLDESAVDEYLADRLARDAPV